MKSEEASTAIQVSLKKEVDELNNQLEDTKSVLKATTDELNHIKYVF